MLTKLRLRYPGLPQYMLSPASVPFHSIGPRTSQVKTTAPVTLPRLPVPDLQQTLEHYLTSLKPLILEDESRGGAPHAEALALRTEWVDNFKNGLGQTLQGRLQGTAWLHGLARAVCG